MRFYVSLVGVNALFNRFVILFVTLPIVRKDLCIISFYMLIELLEYTAFYNFLTLLNPNPKYYKKK